MKWLYDIIKELPNSTKTLIVILIIVIAGGVYFAKEYFSYKVALIHEQNEYGTKVRSLEVALENCE